MSSFQLSLPLMWCWHCDGFQGLGCRWHPQSFVVEGPCLLHSLFRACPAHDGSKEIHTNPNMWSSKVSHQCSLRSIGHHRQTSLTYTSKYRLQWNICKPLTESIDTWSVLWDQLLCVPSSCGLSHAAKGGECLTRLHVACSWVIQYSCSFHFAFSFC